MCLGLKVLSVWGVGEMQVYGICSRRLVYSEVVQTRSNYKKSYLWRFRNPACDGLIGSDRIEIERVGVPPEIDWGKRGGNII